VLTISGLKSFAWSRGKLPAQVEITDIFVGERQYLKSGLSHLIVYSGQQDLRLDLFGKDAFFHIDLIDLEDPK
jgi:hypothetical protein